ncbi:MAG: hypothetical protein FWC58_00370 [Desulfobulbus sp.]|nr:hypothetical protein [Desulfobulbus sp.]
MNDVDKLATLKASIINIGRLLPEGMHIMFHRDPGCMTTLEQVYPDGSMTSAIFTGCSPIYGVPVVPAEFSPGDAS